MPGSGHHVSDSASIEGFWAFGKWGNYPLRISSRRLGGSALQADGSPTVHRFRFDAPRRGHPKKTRAICAPFGCVEGIEKGAGPFATALSSVQMLWRSSGRLRSERGAVRTWSMRGAAKDHSSISQRTRSPAIYEIAVLLMSSVKCLAPRRSTFHAVFEQGFLRSLQERRTRVHGARVQSNRPGHH